MQQHESKRPQRRALPEILNSTGQKNYISGNKVFILGQIDNTSCNELIGNLSNLVDSLDWVPLYELNLAKLQSPYLFFPDPSDCPVIDIYLDSPGGSMSTTKSIMTLLNLARNKGAIIRTMVMGTAASCASIIAVQGTPGFRTMYEQSYNLIHYGYSVYDVDKPTEIDKAAKYEKEMRKNFFAPYLQYTSLTQNELDELQKTEYSMLSARECLRHGMCDWILMPDGKFVKRRITKQKTR